MPIAPTVDLVRRRYNHLAGIYPVFEWLFALPPGIRRAAVTKLRLSSGDAVLEIGCGTGRNFRYMEEAVGPSGHIYGIDVSDRMLSRARACQARHGWSNITLLLGNAMEFSVPKPVVGVLFSLSYGTMERRREILGRVWDQLRPGARVVVMDAKTPPGPTGRLMGALFRRISSLTVFGDPDHTPWEDLRTLGGPVEMEEWAFGSYFVVVGTKIASAG